MKYLVWSIEHGKWWGVEHSGYTTKREKAGRYTLEDAAEICRGANQDRDTPDEAIVPDCH